MARLYDEGIEEANDNCAGTSPGGRAWINRPRLFIQHVGLVDTHCHPDFLFRKARQHGSFPQFRNMYKATFSNKVRGRLQRSGDIQEGAKCVSASANTSHPSRSRRFRTWACSGPYSVSSSVGRHLDFLFRKTRNRGSFEKLREKHEPKFRLNYEGCVAVFCDPETFEKRHVWRGLLSEEGVWGAFGCHPQHMARHYSEDVEDAMIAALEHPRVVALGEISLDYSSK
ncbi:hypothetical protein MTO96_047873 [Rhipicephalus appendiculatus]